MIIIDFFEKLKEFQQLYENETALLPFHFNVIDELHANENAHSRILQKILSYKNNTHFPFLISFLENFLPGINKTITPVITFNQENIDLLIEDASSDFACIIENKIHWAVDQWKQIERYVESVKAHGKTNIYVIYLTRDGNKQVADYSLTPEVQKSLGYKDKENTGNFIPLNYKDDILPWLKNDVLSNCFYKEHKMIAGITQYIDHLEGLFNIREDKKRMNDALMKYIRESFNINGTSTEDFERISECQKLLNEFQTELNNLKQMMIQANPWNLTGYEKASWLAKDLSNTLNNTLEKASPFSKIWIWENNTTVLDQWNYKEHTFAIDISCNNLTGQGVSLALRQRCSAEQYKIICEQYFSSILVKHGWEYRNNWRYMKAYNEITNEDEKNYFIQEIRAFLNDLNLLAKQGE